MDGHQILLDDVARHHMMDERDQLMVHPHRLDDFHKKRREEHKNELSYCDLVQTNDMDDELDERLVQYKCALAFLAMQAYPLEVQKPARRRGSIAQ